MRLYLVRHADPKSEEEDPERSLSELGRKQAEGIARFASSSGVRVNQIRHSGKKRAEQTAEIIGEYLAPAEGVVVTSGIAPTDDVRLMSEKLRTEDDNLMLVGHLPFMNRLVSYLLLGDSECPTVDLPKAGIACLTRENDTWILDWFMHPGLLR